MNKGIKKYRLQGKTDSHRRLLTRGLVMSLLQHQQLKTTPAKAKILKSQFDRLVTSYKKQTSGGEITVTSFFGNNEKAVVKFKKVVDSQLNDRNSGYTRIVRTLPRKGDNADQVFVMLVNQKTVEEKSEVQKLLEKQEKAKKTRKPRATTKKTSTK